MVRQQDRHAISLPDDPCIDRVMQPVHHETLIAQLMGTLQSPVGQLVGIMQTPVQQLIGVLDAYKTKLEAA
jgi:hypothetical protein